MKYIILHTIIPGIQFKFAYAPQVTRTYKPPNNMPGTAWYTQEQIRDVLAYTDPRRPKPVFDEIARAMQEKYGPNRKGTWKTGSIKYIIDNYSMREE